MKFISPQFSASKVHGRGITVQFENGEYNTTNEKEIQVLKESGFEVAGVVEVKNEKPSAPPRKRSPRR